MVRTASKREPGIPGITEAVRTREEVARRSCLQSALGISEPEALEQVSQEVVSVR